ncbi:MAG: antitoxin VapB family protein [Nitrososphaerales archaeon]
MPNTATIRDEVYRKLSAVKRKKESFSQLFERVIEGMNPLDTLTKLRGYVEFSGKEKMLSEIQTRRAERRI